MHDAWLAPGVKVGDQTTTVPQSPARVIMKLRQEVTELTTTSLHEAQKHLSRLIERVAQGEQIIITRRGIPVAVLSPAGSSMPSSDIRQAIEELRALREGVRLAGLSIRELIEEGRL